MSSTTGVQNFLVNVFRPVYTYDPASVTPGFLPRLEVSNIDVYSGNSISVFTAAVGDAASNVYVGSNAGNSSTTIKACFGNTALGWAAGGGISNVSNSTYLGFNAGFGSTNANSVIGLGANVGGNGTSNIFIGNGTKSTGSNNILVGHGINVVASNNVLRVGSAIYGDLLTGWIGIGTPSPSDADNRLDVSGDTYILGNVGININPGERTLDVNGNFRVSDGPGNTLDFNDGLTLSTQGFVSVKNPVSTPVPVAATSVTIGTLKRGIIHVSVAAVNLATESAARILFASSTSNAVDIGSNIASGATSITLSGSNIQISNTISNDYLYSITYFPLA